MREQGAFSSFSDTYNIFGLEDRKRKDENIRNFLELK